MTTINSDLIAAQFTRPRTLFDERRDGGKVKACREQIAILGATAAHASGDVYPLFPIPSNAHVMGVSIYWLAAITGLTSVDLGVYTIAAKGATPVVVDADLFIQAKNLSLVGADIGEGHQLDYPSADNYLQPVWQNLGLAADPMLLYWVCLTLNATPSVDEDVAFTLLYT